MAKLKVGAEKLKVREGDRILVWLEVTRVSDDDEQITVAIPTNGQRTTLLANYLDVVRHEKGSGWPS